MKKYWILALLGVFIASAYPLWMGARVMVEMIANGTVAEENYPQYLIPYTPMCLALLLGVGLMPLFRRAKKPLMAASIATIAVFFVAELLFEKCVSVTGSGVFSVEAWQWTMCAVPRWALPYSEVRTPLELLIGSYNPAFKLHFYMISLVLLLAILGCLYGFAEWREAGKKKRRLLVLQAICVGIFLGLCVLACFTAFWRGPYLNVSPLSAALMAAFFILLGVTAGLFVGAARDARPVIPALTASACTAAMYAGEMILLGGELYRFGHSFFFRGIPYLVLSPADIAIILIPGALTALLMRLLRRNAE